MTNHGVPRINTYLSDVQAPYDTPVHVQESAFTSGGEYEAVTQHGELRSNDVKVDPGANSGYLVPVVHRPTKTTQVDHSSVEGEDLNKKPLEDLEQYGVHGPDSDTPSRTQFRQISSAKTSNDGYEPMVEGNAVYSVIPTKVCCTVLCVHGWC